MPKFITRHLPVLTALFLALASCGPKPMSPVEEARLKAQYLDRRGGEMTPEQKRLFKASRFKTTKDAEELLARFRGMDLRTRRIDEVKDNALAEVAAARVAVNACRENIARIRGLKPKIDNAKEKERAGLRRELKKLQDKSKSLELDAGKKIRHAGKVVSRTPFTMEEKEEIRKRLTKIEVEFRIFVKSAKPNAVDPSETPHAGTFLVETMRAAQNSIRKLRESVEEEAMLVARTEQLGPEKVRGDFMLVHAQTLAAKNRARKRLADARKELEMSLAPKKGKKIFEEELDALEADINKLSAESAGHAGKFKP